MQEISLSVGEMVFDIQNKTYLTGRSREAADSSSYETAANMQVSDDDENLYQLQRSMESAFGELKTILAEYMDIEVSSASNDIDHSIEAGGYLKVSLKLPSNYNTTALGSLAQAMHRYIVCRCISDWFLITNKAESETYAVASAQALEQVRRSIYKRVRPQREAKASDNE